MKRLIFMTGLSALLIGAVGCKSNVCNKCNSCNHGGLGAGLHGGVDPGCSPGPLRWQQGGLDYTPALSHGHYAHQAPGPGIPSAQVAYPYYTVRGPRDFLLDDPPPIGK